MLEKERADIVFMPSAEEMYPERFSSWVEVEKVTDRLEGISRPGHFKGMATVVAKLFNIVEPTRAYFGQKDAQQALVIKKMVADLNMNLEVIVAPTVRESDGLAMSSRNIYLNPQERQAATVLFKALTLARNLWEKGERNAETIRQEMTFLISKEPLAKIEYVSIADAQTLEELSEIDRPALASLAVRIGKTRLIDNVLVSG
jgi:pantoate--beta-alanine ligase